jgi:hypothetical protein
MIDFKLYIGQITREMVIAWVSIWLKSKVPHRPTKEVFERTLSKRRQSNGNTHALIVPK